MTNFCCVCRRSVNDENNAALTMGAFGKPKILCHECEALIDSAQGAHEYEEISDACQKLGEALTRGNTADTQVIDLVSEIINDSMKRAEAIKDGSYDFSADEAESEEQFELTEDLLESEEDRLKDEKEAKLNRTIDTITAWSAGIGLLVALVWFIIKFII